MIEIFFNLLEKIGLKDGIIVALVICLAYFGQQWHASSVEAKNIKLVYGNPEVRTVDRIVYKVGPTRTITKIVERAGGDKETTIDENHDETTIQKDNGSESTIVPLDQTVKPRTNRILLTMGVNQLSMDREGKAVFVGYGWGNRFDLQVGGVEHEGFSPWALATLRF